MYGSRVVRGGAEVAWLCEISGGTRARERERESRDRGEFSGYQRYDSHRSNVLAVCSGDDGLRRINEVAVEINETGVSLGLLGIRVVSVLDSGAEGPGFKSQPRRCRVTVLGKLFTPIVLLFTKQRNW